MDRCHHWVPCLGFCGMPWCHGWVPCGSGWWNVGVLWLNNRAMSRCRMAGCHDWLEPCLLVCMLAKGVDTMMQQVCMLQWVLPKNRMSGAHSHFPWPGKSKWGRTRGRGRNRWRWRWRWRRSGGGPGQWGECHPHFFEMIGWHLKMMAIHSPKVACCLYSLIG